MLTLFSPFHDPGSRYNTGQPLTNMSAILLRAIQFFAPPPGRPRKKACLLCEFAMETQPYTVYVPSPSHATLNMRHNAYILQGTSRWNFTRSRTTLSSTRVSFGNRPITMHRCFGAAGISEHRPNKSPQDASRPSRHECNGGHERGASYWSRIVIGFS